MRGAVTLFCAAILVVAERAPAQAGAASDADTSLAALETRVKSDSLDAETWFRLGRLYFLADRFDDATRAFDAALAADPQYAPAYFWLGAVPFARRPKLWSELEHDKVPAAWRQPMHDALQLEMRAFLVDPFVDLRVPGAKPLPQGMIALPEYKGYEGLTTLWLLEIGLSAFDAARYELAYDALDKFAARAYQGMPADSIPDDLFWYRGLAAAHLGAYNKAIADFQVLYGRGVRQENADTLLYLPLTTNDYRYVLAVLEERYRRPADAVRLYQEAIANDLGLYMAHVRLARLYAQFQMWDKAVAEAQAAVAADPDDASLLLDLGLIERQAGHLAACCSASWRRPRAA